VGKDSIIIDASRRDQENTSRRRIRSRPGISGLRGAVLNIVKTRRDFKVESFKSHRSTSLNKLQACSVKGREKCFLPGVSLGRSFIGSPKGPMDCVHVTAFLSKEYKLDGVQGPVNSAINDYKSIGRDDLAFADSSVSIKMGRGME
jgi:hypothetical protein